jgi:orotate phosphoribosyltransferase
MWLNFVREFEPPKNSMTQEQIIEHFRKTNALLEGHFILSSGLHSPKYLQCALALQNPIDAEKFGKAIAEKFADETFDTVASPAIGGLVIGFVVAQALNIQFIWTERENGAMTVRRGFTIEENERILVVEDVITTGGSTRECIEALEKHGAKVTNAASIIDRSNGRADVGVPRITLASLDVPSYETEDCPMCANGEIAIKLGSRISK